MPVMADDCCSTLSISEANVLNPPLHCCYIHSLNTLFSPIYCMGHVTVTIGFIEVIQLASDLVCVFIICI